MYWKNVDMKLLFFEIDLWELSASHPAIIKDKKNRLKANFTKGYMQIQSENDSDFKPVFSQHCFILHSETKVKKARKIDINYRIEISFI